MTSKQFINAILSEQQSDGSLPVLEGTLGPRAVDIQTLYARHGLLAFDPGFRSTAACKSAITFVDGDQGVLLYRGYPIEELAERSNFVEVAYLLMHGDLPSPAQRKEFDQAIGVHNLLHEQVLAFTAGSGAMPTRWRSWSGWWVRCRPSTTMSSTCGIPGIAARPPSA